jgi:glycosyltransferase involved in cell wall biosynthesis
MLEDSSTPARPRVVRIIDRLNIGGPAKHVVWLDVGLRARGFDPLLVAGTVAPGEGDMGYFAAEQGVEPFVIPEMSRELGWRDVAVIVKLVRLYRRVQPAIIHTHKSKAGAVGRIAAWIYRWATPSALWLRPRPCRVVHTFHGHTFHSYFSRARSRVFLALERMLARFATDAIVVLGEQQRQEINDRFRVGRPGQFRVVPLGIDLAEFNTSNGAARERFGIPRESLVVGIIGRLCAVKNHELFLRAVARLTSNGASSSTSPSFVVVGDGELREDLESKSRQLGLAERVTFLGFRRDVDALYHAFDVVVLTSRNEGTPLTLIEAMACGRPVVATEVGGVVDLLGSCLESGARFRVWEHGLSVASEDAEGLSAALDHLIERPRLGVEMGERGRRFIAARFSKERLVADIAGLYDDLLALERSRRSRAEDSVLRLDRA